jgi:formylglycine-generating enzyme required for sulfatase activity
VPNQPSPIPVPARANPPQPNAFANRPAKAAQKSTPTWDDDDPFAAEDPKNLFEIAEAAPKYEIAAQDDPAQVDRFIVGSEVPVADSSQFVVLAPEESVDRGRANGSFQLPEGFVPVEGYGYSDRGLPLRIRDQKAGTMMALVPGGAAVVGTNDGPSETQPEFRPFLETFYIDVTEVTLAEYARFRDDIKQEKNSRVQPPLNDGQDPQLPALGLPWGIARGFAHWAGKELPTEAEWEKAARGPEGFRTPWGYGRAVWPKPRTPDLIAPAGSFLSDRSIYGVYDLAGNAREWCSDWYSDTAHQEAVKAPERLSRNWAGPKKASVSGQRVVKGNGPDWSAWHREGRAMTERHPDVGFRCVLRVKIPGTAETAGK